MAYARTRKAASRPRRPARRSTVRRVARPRRVASGARRGVRARSRGADRVVRLELIVPNNSAARPDAFSVPVAAPRRAKF